MNDRQLMNDTRTRLHLTQAEMADKLGYNAQSAISDIERGERKLSNVSRSYLKHLRECELKRQEE